MQYLITERGRSFGRTQCARYRTRCDRLEYKDKRLSIASAELKLCYVGASALRFDRRHNCRFLLSATDKNIVELRDFTVSTILHRWINKNTFTAS